MTTQRDLVGKTFWRKPVRGLARLLRDDLASDEAIGSPPYDQPGEKPPSKLGELLATHGGVTVCDSSQLDEMAYNMSASPGILVAHGGFPGGLPTNPGIIDPLAYSLNVVLRMDPVPEGQDDVLVTRAEILGLIIGRIWGDRYKLGHGRLPDPDEPLGPNDSLTKCVSHGILDVTTVGPPEALPGENKLRDDLRFIASGRFRLDDAGQFFIQNPS